MDMKLIFKKNAHYKVVNICNKLYILPTNGSITVHDLKIAKIEAGKNGIELNDDMSIKFKVEYEDINNINKTEGIDYKYIYKDDLYKK